MCLLCERGWWVMEQSGPEKARKKQSRKAIIAPTRARYGRCRPIQLANGFLARLGWLGPLNSRVHGELVDSWSHGLAFASRCLFGVGGCCSIVDTWQSTAVDTPSQSLRICFPSRSRGEEEVSTLTYCTKSSTSFADAMRASDAAACVEAGREQSQERYSMAWYR